MCIRDSFPLCWTAFCHTACSPGTREIYALQTPAGHLAGAPSVVEGRRNLAGRRSTPQSSSSAHQQTGRRQSRVALCMNHLHESLQPKAHTTQPRGSRLEKVNKLQVPRLHDDKMFVVRQIHLAPMVIAASQWYLGTCNAAISPSPQSAKAGPGDAMEFVSSEPGRAR